MLAMTSGMSTATTNDGSRQRTTGMLSAVESCCARAAVVDARRWCIDSASWSADLCTGSPLDALSRISRRTSLPVSPYSWTSSSSADSRVSFPSRRRAMRRPQSLTRPRPRHAPKIECPALIDTQNPVTRRWAPWSLFGRPARAISRVAHSLPARFSPAATARLATPGNEHTTDRNDREVAAAKPMNTTGSSDRTRTVRRAWAVCEAVSCSSAASDRRSPAAVLSAGAENTSFVTHNARSTPSPWCPVLARPFFSLWITVSNGSGDIRCLSHTSLRASGTRCSDTRRTRASRDASPESTADARFSHTSCGDTDAVDRRAACDVATAARGVLPSTRRANARRRSNTENVRGARNVVRTVAMSAMQRESITRVATPAGEQCR